jgi:hypothetical protein
MLRMEHTQQSECLAGQLAGIRVSGACTPNTIIKISCTFCRGFTLWSRLLQNTNKHGVILGSLKILMKLKNMLSRNIAWKNNPRRSRRSMSPWTGSKLIVEIGQTILTRRSRCSFAQSWMSLTGQPDSNNEYACYDKQDIVWARHARFHHDNQRNA